MSNEFHKFIFFTPGYGLTESSPVTFLRLADNKKYASIGTPISDSEARLVDPITKRDVATPGETGELWVRGSHVMKGYYKNEQATKETLLPDGWLRTGDLAYFDQDLDFFITDRLKELIKVKGFQVGAGAGAWSNSVEITLPNACTRHRHYLHVFALPRFHPPSWKLCSEVIPTSRKLG